MLISGGAVRVIVVGAGMGGLVLAQALARAGDDVQVFDRDPDAASTGGYRLHLNAPACAALRQHLHPDVFHAIQASAAGPTAFRQFAITDHRLRALAVDRQDPARERLLVGRVPLRRLLASDLDGRLHFGRTFVRHHVEPDRTVTAQFSDGTHITGDLLVGADGTGSRVAAALAGRPTARPVGLTGIAGRTPISDGTRGLVPDLLSRGPALALGPGGIGMFLATHDPAAGPAVDPATCTRVPAALEPPAFIWGLIAPGRRCPVRPGTAEPGRLRDVTMGLLDRWHPDLRALVEASDPTSADSFAFQAADPWADLTPWPASQVTALGDAVHAMPPTAGQAAATAIRDADALAGRLAAVRRGRATIATAVQGFHTDMAAYAPAAVVESLGPVRWIQALSGPAATLAARAGFTAAAAVTGSLRRGEAAVERRRRAVLTAGAVR